MNKLFIFLILAMTGGVATGCAEEIKGTVRSVDRQTRQVVVRQADGTDRSVIIPEKVLRYLKSGTAITTVLKKGSDVADSVDVEIQ